MLFLVRHGKAGHRSNSDPDDSKRPLTSAGRLQAAALVEPFVSAGATSTVLSSPFLRCMQTVEPLAAHFGTEVVPDQRLAENQPFLPLIEWLDELPDGAVLCSHGDMIPDAIDALVRRGCEIVGAPTWKKASVWALSRNGRGRLVSATAWPPPAVGSVD